MSWNIWHGVYVWFYIAWGLNYFREDFFTRTQTTYVPFSSEHFQSFLDAYTDSLNASWVPIETIDREVVKEAVQEGYRELPTRFRAYHSRNLSSS